MTVPPIVSDKLLFNCPFCGFRNIHEEEVTHHIRYKGDNVHKNIDVDKIDKKSYLLYNTKQEGKYHYEKKEDYGLPWIKCLWCDYEDCVVRDLEWHFLEEHKALLYKELGTPHYEVVDSILARAAQIAMQRSEIVD